MSTELPREAIVQVGATELPGGGETFVIPVIEERLEVGKRAVESGVLRLRKIVHEDVVTINEALAVERTDVERVAIDRPIDAEMSVRYEGDVMIVPVVEERIVTLKQLVLVEEIRVTRRTSVETKPREVTLRREEVIAERLDLASGEWQSADSGQAGCAASSTNVSAPS